jgi:hypothetical protein
VLSELRYRQLSFFGRAPSSAQPNFFTAQPGLQIRNANSHDCEKLWSEANSHRTKWTQLRFAIFRMRSLSQFELIANSQSKICENFIVFRWFFRVLSGSIFSQFRICRNFEKFFALHKRKKFRFRFASQTDFKRYLEPWPSCAQLYHIFLHIWNSA